MKANSPLVTVSVVSHGDVAPLQALLQSLRVHERPETIQLIVTDNLGQDVPQLDQGGWNSLQILRNAAPQGYGRNHNAAAQLAAGNYFCAVNPDVRLVQPTFEQLVSVLNSDKADITAPLVLDAQGRVQDSFRHLPSPLELLGRRLSGAKLAGPLPAGDVLPADWLAGIFLFMETRIFSKLGGFDPGYQLYFEDVDLCTRARLLGLRVAVDAGVSVQHDARRDSRRSGRYLLWHLQSAWRFFWSDAYRRARRLPSAHG